MQLEARSFSAVVRPSVAPCDGAASRRRMQRSTTSPPGPAHFETLVSCVTDGRKFLCITLFVNQRPQFRIGQRMITNCSARITLDQSGSDSAIGRLFLPIPYQTGT